jgi:hypothetical protein
MRDALIRDFTINVRVGGSEHNSIRGSNSLFDIQHVSALLLGHHQVNTEKVLWAKGGFTSSGSCD